MIRGAIFDVDGTLLDSMGIWDTIANDYLLSLNIQPRENLAETFSTFSMQQSAQYYRDVYGVTLSCDQIIEGINGMLADFYRKTAQLKPGVRQFLTAMKENNIRMIIATATDEQLIRSALKRCGILDLFDEILTCSAVGHSKNEPDIYRIATDHLKLNKNEIWVFEDALHAAETAAQDGFHVVGVRDDSEKKQKQLKEKTELYFDQFPVFDPSLFVSTRRKNMKTALSIAGSDCSGGAGIQADLKTMTMNGVFAMSAITALTAQNTTGVRAIMEVTPLFLAQQIDAVFEDIRPDAVKIGMVSSVELIRTIAERLNYYKMDKIVVDPVMVATSGARLINEDAVEVLKKELFPLASVLTPNIPEAEILSGLTIRNEQDMVRAATLISETFHCAVLCKGGHQINDANDLLVDHGQAQWFHGRRINNPNTHGTGCTLSSAIAANLAKGYTLAEAVGKAKQYISRALEDMLDLGQGSGPMNHAFDLKGEFRD